MQYLVYSISPGSLTPETISGVIDRWFRVTKQIQDRLPGAYPSSLTITTSSESGTYVTASEDTWITAIQVSSEGPSESLFERSIRQRWEPSTLTGIPEDDPWESETLSPEDVVEFLKACYEELKRTGMVPP